MKRIFAVLPVLAILAASHPAAADRGRHRPTFAEIDADGNGSVTEEEFVAPLLEHATERFAIIDTNDDGVIVEAELEAAPFPKRPRRTAE